MENLKLILFGILTCELVIITGIVLAFVFLSI